MFFLHVFRPFPSLRRFIDNQPFFSNPRKTPCFRIPCLSSNSSNQCYLFVRMCMPIRRYTKYATTTSRRCVVNSPVLFVSFFLLVFIPSFFLFNVHFFVFSILYFGSLALSCTPIDGILTSEYE